MSILKFNISILFFLFVSIGFSQNFTDLIPVFEAATLANELELTVEQKTEIQRLNLGIEGKRKAVFNNSKITEEERNKHLQYVESSRITLMKSKLSEEQYKKYLLSIQTIMAPYKKK